MFVDDSLFAQVSDNLKHAMVASIKALYMISVYPDIYKRQIPLSLDKYFESIFSFLRTQLDKEVSSRKFQLDFHKQKRMATIDELSHWYQKRKSFTLLGVIFCGCL